MARRQSQAPLLQLLQHACGILARAARHQSKATCLPTSCGAPQHHDHHFFQASHSTLAAFKPPQGHWRGMVHLLADSQAVKRPDRHQAPGMAAARPQQPSPLITPHSSLSLSSAWSMNVAHVQPSTLLLPHPFLSPQQVDHSSLACCMHAPCVYLYLYHASRLQEHKH